MSAPLIVKADCPFAAYSLRWDGNENPQFMAMRQKGCRKEEWTCQFVRAMPPGSVFVDIGANVGSYTLMAAALGHAVIAIEPGYANFHHLTRNLALNNVMDRVFPLQVALSDRAGMDWLHYGDLTAGAASHAMGQPVPGLVPMMFHKQIVPTWPLDKLVADLGLPSPTHIKIDVDGAESKVVAGAVGTLSTCAAAIVETKDEQEAAVVERMAGLGLQRVQRFAERNGQPILGISYSLFIRPAAEVVDAGEQQVAA